MMKKYKSLIIAISFLLIGIIGITIYLIPSSNNENKVLYKYVSAINSGNIEKMNECCEDKIVNEYSSKSEDDKLAYALKCSKFDVNHYLSDDFKAIESIKLLSTKTEKEFSSFTKSYNINAFIRVEYVNSKNEKVSFVSKKTFEISKSNGKFLIIN